MQSFQSPLKSRLIAPIGLASGLLLLGCGGGGSSGGSGGTSSPPVTVTPPSTEFTVSGTASKGLMKDAEILIIGSDSLIARDSVVLARGRTDAVTGEYSLTLDTATLPTIGDFIVVSAAANGANVVCDAPTGCGDGIAFGEDLSVPVDSATTPVAFLSAVVPTPRTGTTTTVNPNIFSHLSFVYFDDILSGRDPLEFRQADLTTARGRVATIFGLDDAAFYTLPFIDTTGTVGSSDQNAIRAALVSGGVQSAVSKFEGFFDDGDGFAWGLYRLSLGFAGRDGEILAREVEDQSGPGYMSLQDIFTEASDFDQVNSTSTNGFQNALQSVRDTLDIILESQPYAETENGEIVPKGPNQPPIINGDYYQAREGETGPIELTLFDPDGNSEDITAILNDEKDSGFFTMTLDGKLTAQEPFDCMNPKDENGDQIYDLNVTISDGEFDVTGDVRLEIFTQDGNYCAVRGQAKTASPESVFFETGGKITRLLSETF